MSAAGVGTSGAGTCPSSLVAAPHTSEGSARDGCRHAALRTPLVHWVPVHTHEAPPSMSWRGLAFACAAPVPPASRLHGCSGMTPPPQCGHPVTEVTGTPHRWCTARSGPHEPGALVIGAASRVAPRGAARRFPDRSLAFSVPFRDRVSPAASRLRIRRREEDISARIPVAAGVVATSSPGVPPPSTDPVDRAVDGLGTRDRAPIRRAAEPVDVGCAHGVEGVGNSLPSPSHIARPVSGCRRPRRRPGRRTRRRPRDARPGSRALPRRRARRR